MMIPIYRVWDSWRKRMSVVDRIYIDTKGVRLYDNFGEYWRDFSDVILMQSTGLKDKNGKEIFEGDIVKRDGIKRPEVVRFGEWIDVDTLGFEEQYIGFYFESEHEGQKRLYSVESRFNNLCKVIGNIYENQELLEEEE